MSTMYCLLAGGSVALGQSADEKSRAVTAVSDVPQQLTTAYEQAVTAWRAFVESDRQLTESFNKRLKRNTSGSAVGRVLLQDEKLHRYLYPWAVQPVSTVPDARSTTPRPIPGAVPVEGELEVVMVWDGDIGTQKPQGNPQGKVKVHVSRKAGPVTVLLGAYSPVEWELTWDDDAQIRKVIVTGFHEQKLTPQASLPNVIFSHVSGKGDSQISFVAGPVASSVSFYLDQFEYVTALMQRKPRGMHGKNRTFRYLVDGSLGDIPAQSGIKPEPVRFRFHPAGGQPVDTLTVEYEGAGAYSEVALRDERISGKWYWEIHTHQKKAGMPIGSRVGVMNYRADSHSANRVVGLPQNIARSLRGGEVLQFAVDLDAGALFVGIDGNWVTGDPNTGSPGVRIRRNRNHPPAAILSPPQRDPYEADRFTFNFGETEFRHAVPAGFEPYDIRFKDKRLAESTRKNPLSGATRVEQDTVVSEILERFRSGASPDFLAELAETLRLWQVYRDTTCQLTAEFRQLSTVTGLSVAGPDSGCIRDFTANLQVRTGAMLGTMAKITATLNADLPLFDQKGAKFHYVHIYSAGQRSASRPRAPVDVSISDTSAPLIVMLHGYEPIHWRLSLAQGVQIRNLVLVGHYKPTYSSEGREIPVAAYSQEEGTYSKVWSYLSKAQYSRLDLRDELARMTGLLPATMQFECPEARCVIDGQQSWRYQSAGTVSNIPISWRYPYEKKEVVGLVENRSRGPGELVRATEARNQGRWYFELKAEATRAGSKRWAGGTIGVVDASSSDSGEVLYRSGATAGSALNFSPGSIVGVALDLEEARIYYSHNGEWIVGDPHSRKGGKELKKGRDYYPAIHFNSPGNMASGLRKPEEVDPGAWRGHFTPAEFAYPAPSGFLPYQSGLAR